MILWILAILLVCVGFLGCFINKIPGPLLAFIGILLPVLFGDIQPDQNELLDKISELNENPDLSSAQKSV